MNKKVIFQGFLTNPDGSHIACLTRGIWGKLRIPITLEVGQVITEELILERIREGIAKIDLMTSDIQEFEDEYQGRIIILDD